MAGMAAAGQAPRAYACTGASCRAPADTVEQWQTTLADLRPSASADLTAPRRSRD
jgi:hypothetical protein